MVLSGLLMGMVGLFVKSLSIIPVYAIVSLRGLFGALIIFLFFILTKRMTLLPKIIHIAPGYLLAQSVAGVVTILCYFYTIQQGGYAYAAFMLYTGPIFAVFMMWLFLKRIPSKKSIGAFFIAIIGLSFLVNIWASIFNADILRTSNVGWVTGLFSGISLGFMTTWKVYYLEKAKNDADLRNDPVGLNIGMALFNVILLFLVFAPFSLQYYPTLRYSHWMIAIALGLFPTAIAFSLLNIGLQHDEGGDVLIFSYSETIMGAFLTAFVDHAFTLSLLIGGVLIITGNLIVAIKPRPKIL
jgi:drug/metabolite transporter (DMT)-like permease